MKTVYPLILATLLMVGSVTSAVAQQALPKGDPGAACEPGAGTAEEMEGEHVLLAIVSEIDRSTNLVTLGTEVGMVEVYAPPESLQDLREGDIILVSVVEEEVPLQSFI